MNPVTISAHWIYFSPKTPIITVAIFCAAPLSATSLPSMAPRTITIDKGPRVSPMPLYTDLVIALNGMPSNSPVRMDTTKKARKAFTFPQVMRQTSKRIPNITMSRVIV